MDYSLLAVFLSLMLTSKTRIFMQWRELIGAKLHLFSLPGLFILSVKKKQIN